MDLFVSGHPEQCSFWKEQGREMVRLSGLKLRFIDHQIPKLLKVVAEAINNFEITKPHITSIEKQELC
jgi:hypothetical protein